MRRVRSFIQRKLSVVRRGSMRVSILWIVLVITVRLRAFFIGEKWFDGDYKTPYDVESWELAGAKMVQVDGEKIKADTYYRCVDGEIVEADE